MFLGEFLSENPQGEAGVGGRPGGHDRQRQRQPGTVADQLGDGAGFGAGPRATGRHSADQPLAPLTWMIGVLAVWA